MEQIQISCKGCGSCCQDVKLPLNGAEATHLHNQGTTLIEILPPIIAQEIDNEGVAFTAPFDWSKNTDLIKTPTVGEVWTDDDAEFWTNIAEQASTLRPGDGYYMILGRCAFLLKDGSCGGYEDRPSICRDFSTGGDACMNMISRAQNTPIELIAKPI